MSELSKRLDALSPEKRALLSKRLQGKGRAAQPGHDAIPRRADGSPAPLSLAQQRLWFLSQLQPDSSFYNMAGAMRLAGDLDVAALEQTLNEIARRHEVLRTSFPTSQGKPVAAVAPAEPRALPVTDLRALEDSAREAAAARLINEESERPFDLAAGPLYRTALFRLADDEHVLLVVMHHIVGDGWSIGVFLRELAALYESFSRGLASPLPELAIQYADFAAWQEQRLVGGGGLDAQLDYWKRQLQGSTAALALPFDRERPATATHRAASENFDITPETFEALEALCRAEGVTLFMALLSVYYVLLQRHTGQEDINLGTPVAGRGRFETEGLIGFFINSLVLRGDLSGEPTFRELLGRVRETVLDAQSNQDAPFEKIVEALQPERTLTQTPLFQAVFRTEEMRHLTGGFELPGLDVTPVTVSNNTTEFDLICSLANHGDRMTGTIIYSADLFEASTIRRLASDFRGLLEGCVADAAQTVRALNARADAARREEAAGELRRALVEWNDTRTEPLPEALFHELFEEQAARTPDALAVIFEGERLTYRELNARANQLAHYLRGLGVGPDVRVGLCIERSPLMLVGLLGVLKAGGAYLPLDPAYPLERLSFMLEDAQVPILLTQEKLVESLPVTWAHVVCLDEEWDAVAAESEENPRAAVGPRDLAYVIYTSGSTGRPKGVMVEHGGLRNLAEAQVRAFGEPPTGRVLQLASLSFDASIFEIVMGLRAGAAVCLGTRESLLPGPPLLRVLREHEITNLTIPPSILSTLPADELPALRTVIVAGEACPAENVARWSPGRRFFNAYGPTETTVWATLALCSDATRRPPIGRPIVNAEVYLLDERQRPVPVGQPGELYIGGDGVARGYLNRPALTAERFVPDPFAGRAGARLYRTGDLARHLPDGQIEFIGRVDHQVKLRGLRIELGEIESLLAEHASVREAVVVLHDGGASGKRLVGYVVPADGDAAPAGGELREHLQGRLPDYMIPSVFVALDQLPLTPNGKIDHRALPAPDAVRAEAEAVYVAPRNRVEEVLAESWMHVLEVERVGIDDNFFALGGDSIRSVQVLSRAQERGLSLTLQQLFKHQTIRQLAEHLDAPDEAAEAAPRTEPFGLVSEEDRRRMPEGVEDAYPLTLMQAGMVFQSELHQGDAIYHAVNSFHLRAPFDERALRAALQQFAALHAVMRTSFDLTGFTEPLQLVHREVEIPLQVDDLRGLDPAEQERAVADWINEDKLRRLDLSAAPLVRFHIHRRTDETLQFTFTAHHAVFDGWSDAVFLTELFRIYLSLVRGDASAAPAPLAVAFRDYVALELEARNSEESRRFWSEMLGDADTTRGLALPSANVEDDGEERFETVFMRLSEEVGTGLNEFARAAGVPLKHVLMAAHLHVMSVLGGRTDVVTGLVSNGRPEVADGERVIGLFLNTLPFRLRLGGGSWEELVRETFAAELQTLPHRRYPLAQIQLDVDGQAGGRPLFETCFNYTHFHVYESLEGAGEVEVLGSTGVAETEFAVMSNFNVDIRRNYVDLLMICDASQLPREQIRLVGEYYRATLEAMAANPRARYDAHSPLTAAERWRLLAEWNDTAATFPHTGTLQELFAAQVARTPDAEALVFEGERLTYRELDARANQLANYLRELGVGPDVRVGVCVERSFEMVVAVLGALKAGAAYVPLDPAYPQERLALMLADASAEVLLTQERLAPSLPTAGLRVVSLDSEWEAVSRRSAETPAELASADNLAYVIYTSGSTGRPKGVAMPHRPLVNLIQWQVERAAGGPPPRALQFASLSFDVSFQEIFTALCSGAALVLVSEEARRDGRRLLRVIEDERVERLCLPFVALNYLAEAAEEEDVWPRGLRQVMSAGEQLKTTRAVRRLFEQLPGCTLDNQCGPSETHAVAAYMLPETISDWPALPPIGRPVANALFYVLDEHLRPVPAGVPGELYIGGPCVSRGYLGRPALTAERYVPNPFAAGERMYRSGDVVRYLPSGDVEWLWRKDEQVKIRGFRVELGEVETALAGHAAVRAAAVVVREDEPGDKRLVAYLVAEEGSSPSDAELRAHLHERLPEYMVPNAFVLLAEMPLTPSGKVSRRALPAPAEAVELAGAGRREGARTEIEELMCGLFAQVLRAREVGVTDSFFDLGGHSLLAMQLVSRVREAYRVEIGLQKLFERPTPRAMAEEVEQALRGGAGPECGRIERVAPGGALPLSYAQQRLWFLDQLEPGSPVYNIPVALRLGGALDARALEAAFNEIIRRHESLRTTFGEDADGDPVQVVGPAWELFLEVEDADADEVARLAAEEARTGFDLAGGPLLRARLLRVSGEEHVLLFTMHHIISDGWSMNVLVREVTALYEAFAAGEASPLAELPIQYADFAAWQRAHLAGGALERQLSFWRRQLSSAPAALELPTDRPRPAVLGDAGATCSLSVPAEVAQSLKGLSRREGATLFMTLLAAWQTLLAKYSRQDDVVVGSPIANRNRAETEGLIGFFVNTLVLRSDLSGDPTFRELLGRVRGVTLGAYANQDVPFERLVEELQPERSMSHTPLFQVLFALQSTMPETMEASGLRLDSWEPEQERAKFDLTLAAIEAGDAINFTLEYKTELFGAETARRMLGHFARLLEAVAADPSRRLSELQLLGDAERRQLLGEFNDTATRYPRAVSLHELFAAQVARTPGATALVYEGEQLTYAELNARANQLAHRLRRHGVGPDVLVGVMMERSVEMVVALLGILKAGGAYVPLDPAYPADRLAFMMEDAGMGVLLTQQRLLGSLPEARSATVIALDAEAGALASEGVDDPRVPTDESNLAYCIYTSGSTGRPKGAMNTHLGICNRLFWMQEAYGLDASDRVLQKTTFSFDVSVWEFFWPLITGARLVMARPGGHQDGAYLVRVIREQQITTMHFVPSMLQVFLEEEGVSTCDSLRRVVCSGEALPFDLQQRFFERLGGTELHNLYGPTEAAVDVTFWPCEKGSTSGVVPIGRAIANTQMYVLDAGMNPAPVGVPGELYIGGVQLARGYLNRPALTAERFVPDPFAQTPGARLYKTGDLARFQPDGNIRYLGRLDHQVKVRGFRIELGEIESALAAHPAVQEAAVVVRQHGPGDQRIVAYVVPDAERAPVLRGLLRLEAEGRAPEEPRYELPNGMPVYHLNRGETDFLYQELFVERAYLRHGVTLRDGAVVFDVGANIGLFSLFVAEACRDAEVFAFEPIPPVFRLLEANATLHGVRARLFNCGVSSRPRTETFTFYPHLSIISGQFAEEAEERRVVRSFMTHGDGAAQDDSLIEELLDDRLSSESYECRLRTISDVIAEHNVERIDLLKVDVEKAEMDVLAGIEEHDWAKIRQVVVEVHDVGGRLQSVESLLTAHGFRLTIDQDEWLGGTNLYNVYATKEPAGVVAETADVRRAAAPTWSSREALVADVQRHLRERLPEYMVPAAFVALAQLPLTPNGKLDRGALPAPAADVSASRTPFVGPRDALELQLTNIWKDVLGVDSVGVRDNFFDRGGHSLLGVRLLARVRKETGVELPAAVLFQEPTVELLAARIRRQPVAGRRETGPLVEIQGGDGRPAFFCVHPSGGNVLCYAELAQRLGAGQPFYGLQARGLDAAEPIRTSVEEMASAYVEAVRAAQPAGPYFLGGWSMGGLIAFEMARQLTAQGHEVARLALIDTTVPTPEGRLVAPDELSLMSSFALDLGLSWEHLRISPEELLGMGPGEQLDYVLGLATSAGVLPPDIEPAQVERLYQVFKTNVLAMINYEPRPWHGRVTLFRAERQEGVGHVGGDWEDFALEGVELVDVPGDHFTMVRPPHVEALADSLARCLEDEPACVFGD